MEHDFPLGGCWSGGMNPVELLLLWGAGVPLSWLLVVTMQHYALRRQRLDIPNERSSHSIPTPVGGGISIAGVTLGLFLFGIWDQTDVTQTRVFAFLLIGAFIAAVGLVDDWWRTLSAKARLFVHIGGAIGFMAFGGIIAGVFIPWVGPLSLGAILGAVATLFWLVGLTNVYNFMDGIDGLAGTQAFLGGSAWALLLLWEGRETLALLAGLIAASSMGFLVLNAPPAKIFMGDVGSTFLGFSFSALTVMAFNEIENPRLLVTGVLFVGVFVFDATLTILRRARNGENLLRSHCSHLYQRLIKLGYSHRTVCIRYSYLMAASIVMGFVYYYAGSDVLGAGALCGILVIYLGLALYVTWSESSPTRQNHLWKRLVTIHGRMWTWIESRKKA
jgi:UDP-N-acetylmuramyl pentapeptide phosphotransferase/UDP-N-acetylglucosamine-1-phosphate transferase